MFLQGPGGPGMGDVGGRPWLFSPAGRQEACSSAGEAAAVATAADGNNGK